MIVPDVVALEEGSLTVYTDSDCYGAGDIVVVSGSVQERIAGESLKFDLFAWTGTLLRSYVADILGNGTYQYQFAIDGTIRLAGEYRIVVNYGGEQAERTFKVSSGTEGGCNLLPLRVDEQVYGLRYKLAGGNVRNSVVDLEARSIIITIRTTTDHGSLKLDIPRSFMLAQDASTGKDLPFSVTINGTHTNFTEITSGGYSRTLSIPFDGNASEIMISGTWLVPEFSHMMLLVGVITSGIVVLFRMIVQIRF